MSAPIDLYPTPTRLELAAGISRGEVTDHGWARGKVTWRVGVSESTVTARVAEFRLAGLLEAPGANGEKPPYPVRLNASGEAWLAEHGGAS